MSKQGMLQHILDYHHHGSNGRSMNLEKKIQTWTKFIESGDYQRLHLAGHNRKDLGQSVSIPHIHYTEWPLK